MNFNYTPTNSSNSNSTTNNYEFNSQQQTSHNGIFPQLSNTNSKEQSFQSPLNNHINLRSTSSSNGSNFSTPVLNLTNLDLFSSSANSSFSNNTLSWSYSRQRYLSSKGFDLEDDLEFCPEITPMNQQQHYLHGSLKFNPYTSMTFSPISPQQQLTEPVSTSPSVLKKTPIQESGSLSEKLSPRLHTPRIKKPLEIINPLTKSKVESPGVRN